ncbi:DNA repair protein RadC, partial [Dysosmobacter welbionis]
GHSGPGSAPGRCEGNAFLPDGLGVHVLLQPGGKIRHGHGAQILTGPQADGDGLVFHIPVAHYQHIGDLLQGGLPDLLADLLVAAVHLHPEAGGIQLLCDLIGVFQGAVCNGQDLHLHRVQPHRERAGKVLGDDADEPLHAAQNHPMDHDGAVLLAVLSGVLQFKPLRQLAVQLDGAALPSAAQGIGQMEVQLGAIESAVALVDLEGLAHVGDSVFQDVLVMLPLLH